MEIRLIGEHDQVDDAVVVLREQLNVTAVSDGHSARGRRNVRVYVHVEPRLYTSREVAE